MRSTTAGVYIVADEKPKRRPARELRRLANLRANPRAALVVDDYDDDWTPPRLRARARPVVVLADAAAHAGALELLRVRYPQYRAMALDDPSRNPVSASSPHASRSGVLRAAVTPAHRSAVRCACAPLAPLHTASKVRSDCTAGHALWTEARSRADGPPPKRATQPLRSSNAAGDSRPRERGGRWREPRVSAPVRAPRQQPRRERRSESSPGIPFATRGTRGTNHDHRPRDVHRTGRPPEAGFRRHPEDRSSSRGALQW